MQPFAPSRLALAAQVEFESVLGLLRCEWARNLASMSDAGFRYPGQGGPVADPIKTNLLAIISLCASFIVPVAGVVLGHLAISQIRRTREEGLGLARAGLIVGYVYCGLIAVFFVIWLSLFLRVFNESGLSAG